MLSVRNFECERNESWGASVQGSAKKGTCGLGRRVESRLPAWVGGSPCWDGGRTGGNSATALCWALTYTPFTLSPPCGSSGLPLPGEAEARKVKLPTRAAQPAGPPHPAGASRTRGAPPSSPYSPTAPSPSSCQVRHPGLVTLRRSLGGGQVGGDWAVQGLSLLPLGSWLCVLTAVPDTSGHLKLHSLRCPRL